MQVEQACPFATVDWNKPHEIRSAINHTLSFVILNPPQGANGRPINDVQFLNAKEIKTERLHQHLHQLVAKGVLTPFDPKDSTTETITKHLLAKRSELAPKKRRKKRSRSSKKQPPSPTTTKKIEASSPPPLKAATDYTQKAKEIVELFLRLPKLAWYWERKQEKNLRKVPPSWTAEIGQIEEMIQTLKAEGWAPEDPFSFTFNSRNTQSLHNFCCALYQHLKDHLDVAQLWEPLRTELTTQLKRLIAADLEDPIAKMQVETVVALSNGLPDIIPVCASMNSFDGRTILGSTLLMRYPTPSSDAPNPMSFIGQQWTSCWQLTPAGVKATAEMAIEANLDPHHLSSEEADRLDSSAIFDHFEGVLNELQALSPYAIVKDHSELLDQLQAIPRSDTVRNFLGTVPCYLVQADLVLSLVEMIAKSNPLHCVVRVTRALEQTKKENWRKNRDVTGPLLTNASFEIEVAQLAKMNRYNVTNRIGLAAVSVLKSLDAIANSIEVTQPPTHSGKSKAIHDDSPTDPASTPANQDASSTQSRATSILP